MVELYVRVGQEGLFVAVEPPIDRRERRLWLQHRLETPSTLVLVAITADQIIGYLTAIGSERDPAKLGLGVAKTWRGRGVGTRLVATAISWGCDHDVHKVAADVFPHNQPTLHLFDKLGFEREGLAPRPLSPPDGGSGASSCSAFPSTIPQASLFRQPLDCLVDQRPWLRGHVKPACRGQGHARHSLACEPVGRVANVGRPCRPPRAPATRAALNRRRDLRVLVGRGIPAGADS